MRAVRILGVVVLAVAVCGALAAGVASAWVLSRGAPAGRPTVTRSDAPLALGSGAPPALRARIEPVGSAPLHRRVLVENPNARAVSGLRVVTAVDGGTCEWVDGPFPQPFGLPAGGGAGRTCRLSVEPATGTATVEVSVEVGGRRAATASATVAVPPPPSTAAVAPVEAGPAPAAGGPAPVAGRTGLPGGGPGTTGVAAPCPRLVDGLDLAPTPSLDRLGPALTDRARLLDVDGCPEWASLGGLQSLRAGTGEPCPPWELQLAPGSGPVARLAGPQQDGCPALPLEIEVLGEPTSRAAQLATLAAWSVEGSGSRARELHQAAATGTGSVCAGAGSVALTAAYEQPGGAHRAYRVTVLAC